MKICGKVAIFLNRKNDFSIVYVFVCREGLKFVLFRGLFTNRVKKILCNIFVFSSISLYRGR